MKKHYLPVVVGLFKKNNKILLGQRPNKKSKKIFWEFPGGKFKKNETASQVLKRELKEELGIEVIKYQFLEAVLDTKNSVLLLFYKIQSKKGRIKSLCHKELKWFTLKECNKKKLPNMNKNIFKKILNIMKKA